MFANSLYYAILNRVEQSLFVHSGILKMNFSITSKTEGSYLLLAGEGPIVSMAEYKTTVRQYVDEVQKQTLRKIVVDQRKVDFGPSLINQMDIVTFTAREMPEEIKTWKIAVVMSDEHMILGEFWKFSSKDSGYSFETFSNIDAAIQYICECDF